jgi:hypothetical protein
MPGASRCPWPLVPAPELGWTSHPVFFFLFSRSSSCTKWNAIAAGPGGSRQNAKSVGGHPLFSASTCSNSSFVALNGQGV